MYPPINKNEELNLVNLFPEEIKEYKTSKARIKELLEEIKIYENSSPGHTITSSLGKRINIDEAINSWDDEEVNGLFSIKEFNHKGIYLSNKNHLKTLSELTSSAKIKQKTEFYILPFGANYQTEPTYEDFIGFVQSISLKNPYAMLGEFMYINLDKDDLKATVKKVHDINPPFWVNELSAFSKKYNVRKRQTVRASDWHRNDLWKPSSQQIYIAISSREPQTFASGRADILPPYGISETKLMKKGLLDETMQINLNQYYRAPNKSQKMEIFDIMNLHAYWV